MSFKEKSTWIMAIITAVAYAYYVSLVLGQSVESVPITELPYAKKLSWTIGVVIVATIIAHILVVIASPEDGDKQDQRDREIERYGEYAGHWFIVAGAVGALVMSVFELSHFWIANAIYLAFVLATLFGSAVKILAYRRGFPLW